LYVFVLGPWIYFVNSLVKLVYFLRQAMADVSNTAPTGQGISSLPCLFQPTPLAQQAAAQQRSNKIAASAISSSAPHKDLIVLVQQASLEDDMFVFEM
jgi:hypothetical protein